MLFRYSDPANFSTLVPESLNLLCILTGNNNEEILSDASDVEGRNDEETNMLSDDSDAETAEEKRLRLAKKYLEEIERQGNY